MPYLINRRKEFSELLGKTLEKVTSTADDVTFITTEGEKYILYHNRDFCEAVWLEDIAGNEEDLIGSPILIAEETSNCTDPPKGDPKWVCSYTWTFYKLATIKGYVTYRFYGESNGYYSEAVDFAKEVPYSEHT